MFKLIKIQNFIKYSRNRTFLNIPILKIRKEALEIQKKNREKQEKEQNQTENEKSGIFEDNVVFGIRVLVLLSLMTGIVSNNRLFKQCGDDSEIIQQIEYKMDKITSEICNEEFRQNILNSLDKGEKDVVKKSIAKLIEDYEIEETDKKIEDSITINE